MHDCKKCGKCCNYYYIFGKNDEDMAHFLAVHYGVDKCEEIKAKIFHRCLQLDENNRCLIYDSRPKKCRDYFCGPKTIFPDKEKTAKEEH